MCVGSCFESDSSLKGLGVNKLYTTTRQGAFEKKSGRANLSASVVKNVVNQY